MSSSVTFVSVLDRPQEIPSFEGCMQDCYVYVPYASYKNNQQMPVFLSSMTDTFS